MGSERRPVIVGTGIAGLYVALRAQELGLRAVLLTKSRLEESNTKYAQGGIAAAIGPGDTVRRHLADTVRAGAGLVDGQAAHVLTSDAPARIANLVAYGVPFDTVEGHIALGLEAAHSRARVLHAGGDATGLRIEETLRARTLERGIEVRERTVLRQIEPGPAGSHRLTVSRPDGGSVEELEPAPVVLATGGAGRLYHLSSNPRVATGDGIAAAFRAGAVVSDLEFMQFHPTAFFRRGAPRFLITEALRGEGAVLRNAAGRRFLLGVHPAAELAPRDVVARAIHAEMLRSGEACVYLDATALPRDRLLGRFPTICRFLAEQGLDPSADRIPISPVAHYTVGGVMTDLEGRTSLRGLFACGEVAATGVHGANRLASNSLLEGLVFGERVARQLAHRSNGRPALPGRLVRLRLPRPDGEAVNERAELRRIGSVLWDQVGIVRDAEGLGSAVAALEAAGRRLRASTPGRLASPGENAGLTALLIARAALERTESRGAHYRSDYPRPSSAWRTHLGLVRADRGRSG